MAEEVEANKESDGSVLEAALNKGTGVFEGREDSPGVALGSCMGCQLGCSRVVKTAQT